MVLATTTLFAVAWLSTSSASAAVSYVGSQVGSGNCTFVLGCSASAQVNVPAGTANGDLMIATVQFQQSVLGISGYSAASGWTLLRQSANFSGVGYVYYRIAGSEPSSYSWSDGFIGVAGSVTIAAQIDVYSGNDTITPLSSGASSTGSSQTVALPNDTASYAGSMRISSLASYSTSSSNSTSTFQSGLTLTAQTGASNGNAVNVAAAYAAQGAGTTTSYNDALSGPVSGWLATTYVINPFAQRLAFTTQPVAGVGEGVALPTQPTVKVQDAAGVTDTADTSTVTLAIASGPAGGVLSCTGGLSKAAVAGVATFSGCQITGTAAAGTYTLTATDGSLASATSSSFTITVGGATRLAFTTEPVGALLGAVFLTQPVVSVEDANGNLVLTDASTVSIAIASGPATGSLSCIGGLSGAAVAGVAAFAGCDIAVSGGTYTLTATDGTLTAALSAAFSVTGALGFSGLPGLPTLSGISLNGQAQTSYSTMTPFAVIDTTGSGAGWNVTVQGQTGGGNSAVFAQYCPTATCGTDTGPGYVSGGYSLPADSLMLTSTGAGFSAQNGSIGPAPTLPCNSGCYVDSASPVTVATAATNAGEGTWLAGGWSASSLALSTPATLRVLKTNEVYRVNLVWSLASGP